MPQLRAHRKDRRFRAAKVRRRRHLTKFVPSSDSDFAMTSRGFAKHVWEHREELGVSERDAEYLCRLVRYFREALTKATSPLTGNTSATAEKNRWRKELEQWLRPIGAKIRNDRYVDQTHKVALRLVGLGPRRSNAGCPQRPPMLQFIGAGDGVNGEMGAGNGSGVHVLRVFDRQDDVNKPDVGVIRKSRPDGASGIELWVGFIPEGVGVPSGPQEYLKMGLGWPLFLRKYTTHTVEAQFPMPDRPMLIVYWARWTNNAGDQGRYCKTCVARIEGWPKTMGVLPEELEHLHAKQVKVEHGARYALPGVEAKMLEGQRMFAKFLLVGTPLAQLMGSEDEGADELPVRAQLMLPEAA